MYYLKKKCSYLFNIWILYQINLSISKFNERRYSSESLHHTLVTWVIFNWFELKNVEFWKPELWPPCSPDLNPLDYSVWARLVKHVNSKRHTSVSDLKEAIKCAWSTLDEEYVRKITGAFRHRLEAVIHTGGECQF